MQPFLCFQNKMMMTMMMMMMMMKLAIDGDAAVSNATINGKIR